MIHAQAPHRLMRAVEARGEGGDPPWVEGLPVLREELGHLAGPERDGELDPWQVTPELADAAHALRVILDPGRRKGLAVEEVDHEIGAEERGIPGADLGVTEDDLARVGGVPEADVLDPGFGRAGDAPELGVARERLRSRLPHQSAHE